jgi:hypothetical protein
VVSERDSPLRDSWYQKIEKCCLDVIEECIRPRERPVPGTCTPADAHSTPERPHERPALLRSLSVAAAILTVVMT